MTVVHDGASVATLPEDAVQSRLEVAESVAEWYILIFQGLVAAREPSP